MDFRALLTLEQACAAAREAAKSGGPLADWVALPVPEYSELWHTNLFTQHDLVRIPIDARAQRMARSRLGNPWWAGQAAVVLAVFPSVGYAEELVGLVGDR